jgi:hypothetical protein
LPLRVPAAILPSLRRMTTASCSSPVQTRHRSGSMCLPLSTTPRKGEKWAISEILNSKNSKEKEGIKQMTTKLLEKAFEEASRLPEMDQNALARWVLDELQSERMWAKSFSESEDVLERLADEAICEKRRGKTTRLDLQRL